MFAMKELQHPALQMVSVGLSVRVVAFAYLGQAPLALVLLELSTTCLAARQTMIASLVRQATTVVVWQYQVQQYVLISFCFEVS